MYDVECPNCGTLRCIRLSYVAPISENTIGNYCPCPRTGCDRMAKILGPSLMGSKLFRDWTHADYITYNREKDVITFFTGPRFSHLLGVSMPSCERLTTHANLEQYY